MMFQTISKHKQSIKQSFLSEAHSFFFDDFEFWYSQFISWQSLNMEQWDWQNIINKKNEYDANILLTVQICPQFLQGLQF